MRVTLFFISRLTNNLGVAGSKHDKDTLKDIHFMALNDMNLATMVTNSGLFFQKDNEGKLRYI